MTKNTEIAAAVAAGSEKDPVCVVAQKAGHYMGNVTVAPSSAPLIGQPKPFKG
jgi:hypothetical protein